MFQLSSVKVKVGFERKSALCLDLRPSLQCHQSWDRLDPGRGGLSVPLLQPTCLGDLSFLRLAVPRLSRWHLCFHLFHCLPHPHHCDCSICTYPPRAQAVLVGSPCSLEMRRTQESCLQSSLPSCLSWIDQIHVGLFPFRSVSCRVLLIHLLSSFPPTPCSCWCP